MDGCGDFIGVNPAVVGIADDLVAVTGVNFFRAGDVVDGGIVLELDCCQKDEVSNVIFIEMFVIGGVDQEHVRGSLAGFPCGGVGISKVVDAGLFTAGKEPVGVVVVDGVVDASAEKFDDGVFEGFVCCE